MNPLNTVAPYKPHNLCTFLSVGTMLATALCASLNAQPGGSVTPVATGLNSPRGLAFGPNGNLYVTEAGLGAGDGQGGFGEGVGLTGSITEIRNVSSPNPTARKMVTGLASQGTNERGASAVGPDGISILGNGQMFVVMAESKAGVLAADPETDPSVAANFGQLLKLNPSGTVKKVADVGGYDYTWTMANQDAPWAPAGQFPDANPFGVLALPGHQYVVDAAANTLNEVQADGSIRIVAYVPNPLFPAVEGGPGVIPISDSVPTCVAQGPDGFLYVGTLAFGANFARFSGKPFWAGLPPQSKVYRINPSASEQFLTDADVWAAEFSPITACGFGPGGFYVVEYQTQDSHFATGDVVKVAINADGSAGARTSLGVGALHEPTGFAVGPDGSIYVSNFSVSFGGGEVVRVNQ